MPAKQLGDPGQSSMLMFPALQSISFFNCVTLAKQKTTIIKTKCRESTFRVVGVVEPDSEIRLDG